MSASFEYLRIEKKKKFKDAKDEELVKQAQQETDEYRMYCDWTCPECKKSVSYIDSLLILDEIYIHETRAYALNIKCEKSDSCKKKMSLHRRDGKTFSSDAFEELFARYQGWIVHESERAKAIDSPEEIYGDLCAAFSKVVSMFARTGDFSKTSEKWFSSFFYKSIQNKISDIQKTKNYQKRSPLIKCEVCGDYIGKITSKHLLSEGHETFVKKLYIEIGEHILSDSGEIHYYDNRDEYERRALILGAMSLAKKDKREVIKKLISRALALYFDTYPNAKSKNYLLSTNMPIDEEENNTIEDTYCKSVTTVNPVGAVEDIYIQETVNMLVEIFYDNNEKNSNLINRMFKSGDISLNKRKIIIKEIIFDKMSYHNLKNLELDKSYGAYVKSGFTSRILRMIKNDKACRMELLSSFREHQ